MSTSKFDRSGLFKPVSVHGQRMKLSLSNGEVVVRKSGIEFLSPTSIPIWTELIIELRSRESAQPLHGNAVVVDCVGNRHSGYVVSLVFSHLAPESQRELRQLVTHERGA
ncbi:MAG: hypothetical protein ACYC23_08325 [Limisphaerales bacterium]